MSYWAREMEALDHEVRLIAPQYVRPCVKRQTNDDRSSAHETFDGSRRRQACLQRDNLRDECRKLPAQDCSNGKGARVACSKSYTGQRQN